MTPAPFFVSPKYPDQVYDATGTLIASFYGPNAAELAAWFAMTPALRLTAGQLFTASSALDAMGSLLKRTIDSFNNGLSVLAQAMPTDGPTQAAWQKDATRVQAASA